MLVLVPGSQQRLPRTWASLAAVGVDLVLASPEPCPSIAIRAGARPGGGWWGRASQVLASPALEETLHLSLNFYCLQNWVEQSHSTYHNPLLVVQTKQHVQKDCGL